MARALLTNNASTTLAAGINNTVTSMSVASGTGALFPAPGANYFYCTLAEGALIEIVKVTARTTDTFTIVRAQDGTTAQAFTTAALVRLNLTAAVITELQDMASKDASGGYAGLTLFKLNLKNAANTFTSFLTNASTAVRTWAMQDRDGTVALTDDITGGTRAGSFTTLAVGVAAPLTLAHVQGAYTANRGVIQIDDATAQALGTGGGIAFGGKYTDAGAYTSGVIIRAAKTNGTTGNYAFDTAFLNYVSGDANMTERLRITSAGNVLVTSAGGLGYGIGAGATVTQATSRTTAPAAINKPSGDITLVSAAGSTTPFSFTVSNSLVAATDRPQVIQKSGTDKYIIHVTNVGTGSFQITAWTTGGTTTEQPVFGFNIHKGSAS